MVVVHRVHRARAALAGCTTTSAGRSLEAFKGAPAEAYQDGWSIKPHGAICCRPANRIGHVGGFKDRRWCRIQCSCLRLLWRVDRRVRRRALMERDVPPVSFGLSARVFLYPVKGLADGREANRDAIRQRVESYMKCVVGLGFTPADVFSSGEAIPRQVAEVIYSQMTEVYGRQCQLHRRWQAIGSDPMQMLSEVLHKSSGVDRSICLVGHPPFLKTVYTNLKKLDNKYVEKDATGQEFEDDLDPAMAMHPEAVLEISVLNSVTTRFQRCFVEHQFTYTRKHRHKILTIVLIPTGVASDRNPMQLTDHSETCLRGLLRKPLGLTPGSGASAFLADSSVPGRLSVAFLLENTTAAFLPIFISQRNPQKVVRAIASQPAGTRTFLMAPVAILKEVAQLLLGVDSTASDSIEQNVVIVLQHSVPAASYETFEIATKCIDTMLTAVSAK